MKKPQLELLLSSARGIYIPRDAVEFLQSEDWKGFDKSLLASLSDPCNEFYWDNWVDVSDNAYYIKDGVTYTLHQDGDLWAVPEIKYLSPDEIFSYVFCGDVDMQILYSLSDDDKKYFIENNSDIEINANDLDSHLDEIFKDY